MTSSLLPAPQVPATKVPLPDEHRLPTDADAVIAYLTSLAASGRRSMRVRLQAAARLLGEEDIFLVRWSRLRFEHVSALRTALSERDLSPAAVNATIYAIRGVMRASWNLGLLPGDDYQRIREVKPVQAHRLPRGRALSRTEVLALVDACGRDMKPRGIRDLAVVAILFTTGVRREELVGLDLSDLSPEKDALRVLGKGNRERLVYPSRGARAVLDRWLSVRGCGPGPLLLPTTKGGRLVWRRLTGQSVHALLRRRAREAGVLDLTPHDMRRTFVSTLLALGVDIAVVQRMAGHQSVVTTTKYDRRGDEEKRRAAELLDLPLPDPFLSAGGCP